MKSSTTHIYRVVAVVTLRNRVWEVSSAWIDKIFSRSNVPGVLEARGYKIG